MNDPSVRRHDGARPRFDDHPRRRAGDGPRPAMDEPAFRRTPPPEPPRPSRQHPPPRPWDDD
ncbi:MAG TPA: hypothetical protein VGD67_16545, partial [Pseudonocardiaceae bacterium]